MRKGDWGNLGGGSRDGGGAGSRDSSGACSSSRNSGGRGGGDVNSGGAAAVRAKLIVKEATEGALSNNCREGPRSFVFLSMRRFLNDRGAC